MKKLEDAKFKLKNEILQVDLQIFNNWLLFLVFFSLMIFLFAFYRNNNGFHPITEKANLLVQYISDHLP